MKTKLQTITLAFSMMFFLTGCDENKIEFEVKAEYDIDAVVTTTYVDNTPSDQPITSFEVASEIDLSDKIDDINSITTLEVTGVTLELKGYNAYKRNSNLQRIYTTDKLEGNLEVILISNNQNKIIFKGNVNLGTNQIKQESEVLDKIATPLMLSIITTPAKDFIEGEKVKLIIKMTDTKIYDNRFTVNIKTKTRAITAI